MANEQSSLTQKILSNPLDFSLVLGGFLFQFFRRAHLTGNAGQLLRRRIIAITLIAWLPLLTLSVISGNSWGESVQLPFLIDIEMHIRFLIALPLLVFAELIVHQRLRPLVTLFIERGLIPPHSREQFDKAIESAMRLRNSVVIELLLIAVVYVFGILFIWRTQIALDISSWYALELNGQRHLTPAGWWLSLISLPLFQFLLLRWYFRLFIWTRFLWQVSKIPLSLIPTNPDRACGLGFLTEVCYVFLPLLLAQGVLLAGMLCERIFFKAATLSEFKTEIVGMVVLILVSILGPLLVFMPQLLVAKREGLQEYGTLAEGYVREFDLKWLHPKVLTAEPFIGSNDIQSLADLSTSFDIIKGVRPFPFNLQNVIYLCVFTLLPVAPLLLTMFSVEDLLLKILKILFS